MIEIFSAERCISCDKCIDVCPTRVFDRGPDGLPVIARQDNCQTCFQCEAYCPTDALFVATQLEPVPDGSPYKDLQHVLDTGLLGSYRRALGWGKGRTLGARIAIQPEMP